MTNQINAANWNVRWRVTESSGLAVYLCDYKKKRVVWEASLPYVTIDHQPQELEADMQAASHGPFWMPLGTRTLASEVRHNVFRGGFEIAADFKTGPFHYTQLWRFFEDGRMSPWLTIHGDGLHDGHAYHPHWRLDFDVGGSIRDSVEYFDGTWRPVKEESWLPSSGQADQAGSVWRQVSTSGHVDIRPHRWEDGELFALRYHASEGAPFTPRNSVGAQPYPAAYMGSESLDGEDVTLWYVAHVHYGMAFPYTAGPTMQVHF